MNFVSIVKLLDLLAWPLLSVVYPLCASIRTIESDSNSDPRKLVAYWILFSLIFLFERTFVNLLPWVPFWPYIKMITSLLLVIPNFDGAFYVYQHFVRPCLPMDTNFLHNNQFKESEEFVTEGNNLATEVKRYVTENRPQSLEVASEVKVQSANNFVKKDEKAVEVTEKKDVDAAKQVTRTEPGLSQTENKILPPGEIKEISDTVEPVRDFCELPISTSVQREWTCATCQVITQSETTLNSHLRGKRHRETCKELKEKNQPSKTKIYASEHKKSDKTVQELENGASTSSRRQSRRQRKLQQQQENIKHKQSLFWCKICNRSCNSKHDLQCHLNGRKHLAQVGQLKGGT